MFKPIILSVTSLIGVGLAALIQPPPPPDGPPPHGKAEKEKKGAPGPEGDLRRAYDLLRKLRAENGAGRSEDKLQDWTDRATGLYRKGIKALAADDRRLGHEYGAAAHDLARAVDHARHAAQLDHSDPDLPPPPEGRGPDDDQERTIRDLRHAYDRIEEAKGAEADEARYYLDAARDLYKAARRDAEADRFERAGELARAAEAMTHVPEHLAHASGRDDGPRPDPKGRREGPKGDERPRPEPKGSRPGRDLPPPL